MPNYFLGIELFKTNRYPEARTFLKAAITVNPAETQARWWLGATYIGLKEYPKGIHQYREILKQEPQNADALYAIGKIYVDRMEHSLKKMSGGSEAVKSITVLRFELGKLALKEGKTEEAKRLFQEELVVDPWSFQAHYGLLKSGSVCVNTLLSLRSWNGPSKSGLSSFAPLRC